MMPEQAGQGSSDQKPLRRKVEIAKPVESVNGQNERAQLVLCMEICEELEYNFNVGKC